MDVALLGAIYFVAFIAKTVCASGPSEMIDAVRLRTDCDQNINLVRAIETKSRRE
jgi:hypothetical protein